jgi:UDP-N-acetylmuramoyl-tripeptide--D-alanyl-D-alanine ligase
VLNLKDIIIALTGHEIAPLGVRLSSAVIDSRQAVEGSLFIALPGDRVDGHDYVQAAFNNGALLALIHQELSEDYPTLDLRSYYFDPNKINVSLPMCLRVENTLIALQGIAAHWREKHPVRTVGITGSVGKTSTKELTAALLSQKFCVLKNPGNRNNEIGLPLTLLSLENHHECAVLEMGFYVPGEIRTLCDIAHPHIGIVTNIGAVHAERAGSQANIAKGKAELVESLPSAPQGIAILNWDDPWVRKMEAKTQAQVLTYGINKGADLTATGIESLGLAGVSCTLTYQGQSHQVQSPLLGAFSVYTILAASAAALAENLEWDMIKAGLSTSRFDQRMRQFSLSNGAIILDDTYNASPASTIAALEFLSGLPGRRVAVLGDMLELGPYEQSGHQSVGAVAASAADVLILVGNRAKMIAEAAIENGFSEAQLHWYPNSKQAANPIASKVEKGDIVLIKGSNSMRMDRIIANLEACN